MGKGSSRRAKERTELYNSIDTSLDHEREDITDLHEAGIHELHLVIYLCYI